MSTYFKSDKPRSANDPERQKLVPEHLMDIAPRPDACPMDIKTLHGLLQYAIHLELTTIPAYLTTLYSIKEGTNEASSIICRSIAVEEMLHMVMAANILNAVGGKPHITSAETVPAYPAELTKLCTPFPINLEKFSQSSISTFMEIEQPHALPKHHCDKICFESIGDFYNTISEGMKYLEAEASKRNTTIFTGNHKLQVTENEYYGAGGKLIAVYKIEDALIAISEIVGQGEGVDGSIIDPDSIFFHQDVEYAHYYRFKEIYCGRYYCEQDKPHENPNGEPFPVDWDAVHNMQLNPKLSDYKVGSELWNNTYEFNKTYMALLENIEKACTGNPKILRDGIGLMYDLKYKATALMNMPTGNLDNDGKPLMAGPTFERI